MAFVLSSGRLKLLVRAIRSIELNNVKADKICIIHDSTSELHLLTHHAIQRTHPPHSGHWVFAFQKALSTLPDWADFFFIMHDDDQLKSDYIDTCITHLNQNPKLIAVSCSLENIDSEGRRLDRSEFRYSPTLFQDRDSVLEYYLQSCIPFPSVFYRKQKLPYASMIQHKFGSFADGLFLAELSQYGGIEILPKPLYQYRRHSGQMSVMQSKKAEFLFLGELVRRSSRSVRSKNYAKASYRGTLTSLNEIRKNQNLDSIYDQRMADLDFSWRAALSKPKLLLRAGLAIAFRPKSWLRSEASVILEHEKKIQTNLTVICFSKDRPMQLAALLQSLKVQARIPCKIHVIFKASNSETACAYNL